MPKKSGFEVCKHIRSTPDLQNTPIIILSAIEDELHKLTVLKKALMITSPNPLVLMS